MLQCGIPCKWQNQRVTSFPRLAVWRVCSPLHSGNDRAVAERPFSLIHAQLELTSGASTHQARLHFACASSPASVDGGSKHETVGGRRRNGFSSGFCPRRPLDIIRVAVISVTPCAPEALAMARPPQQPGQNPCTPVVRLGTSVTQRAAAPTSGTKVARSFRQLTLVSRTHTTGRRQILSVRTSPMPRRPLALATAFSPPEP